jgi:tRNA(Ile)-lysidine synthase
MPLLARVSRFARRYDLWRHDSRVIAAVSGGSDSVALLLLLRELHARGELILDAVAHLHHGIRGAEADGDEEFCRALAEALDVPFETARVDVPGAARLERRSIEVAARHARRDFFARVRRARSAHCVATGHTEDDQAETVLLRMTRGTGLRGLGGIAPSRGGVVRPLLTCSRRVLRAHLEARQQPWREDATNADLSNPRNRVRHELMLALERHFNPAVRATLARLADLARSDEDLLSREAAAVALWALQFDHRSTARLDPTRLADVHPAIARRVVQRALEVTSGRAFHSADEVDAVQDVLTGERRGADLSGLRVEHSGDFVVLIKKGPDDVPAPPFRFSLPIPGAVQATDGRWVLEAEGPCSRLHTVVDHSPDVVQIAAEGLGRSLVVRSRQPGDRIRPTGLGGRKKLQDVLVDRKVRRIDRDRIPVVTDEEGRMVWVAGHVLDEGFKVTDHTKAVIILRLRRIARLRTWSDRDAG